SVSAFSVSISYAKRISAFFLSRYTDSFSKNIAILMAFFVVTSTILVAWLPFVQEISTFLECTFTSYLIKWGIISSSTLYQLPVSFHLSLPLHPTEHFLHIVIMTSAGKTVVFPNEFTTNSLGYLSNFTRLLIAIVFFGFALMKPFLK